MEILPPAGDAARLPVACKSLRERREFPLERAMLVRKQADLTACPPGFHIVEPAERDELRVDRHQPGCAFGLEPLVSLRVDVEHPDIAFSAHVANVKLAEFALSRAGEQAEQRHPVI